MLKLATAIPRGRLMTASLLLVLQATVYYTLSGSEVVPSTAPWRDFPRQIGPWNGLQDTPIEAEVLDRLRPDDYMYRSYRSGSSDRTIDLFIGYFLSQRRGFLPHSPEDCLPGAGWKAESSSVVSINVSKSVIRLNRFVAGKGGTRLLILYWYQTGDKTFTTQAAAQLHSLPQVLSHGRTDIWIARVILAFPKGQEKASEAEATAFVRALWPAVLNHMEISADGHSSRASG